MATEYNVNLEYLKGIYPNMKMFSYMFYSEPGKRDIQILEKGIKNVIPLEMFGTFKGTPDEEYPLWIMLENITQEEANAYGVNRGWLIRFYFPYLSDEKVIDEDWWKGFISGGLDALRVEHKFIHIETYEGT